MTTIDKLDLSVYNLYAMRTMMIEQINKELAIDKASTIPPQTTVVDLVPHLNELDLLLGVVPMSNPWAYFYPPRKFRHQRRSPFAFFRIAPSFGSLEEQEEMENNLSQVATQTPEEEEEKKILFCCLKKIDWINQMMSFIVGRVGQFLQG